MTLPENVDEEIDTTTIDSKSNDLQVVLMTEVPNPFNFWNIIFYMGIGFGVMTVFFFSSIWFFNMLKGRQRRRAVAFRNAIRRTTAHMITRPPTPPPQEQPPPADAAILMGHAFPLHRYLLCFPRMFNPSFSHRKED